MLAITIAAGTVNAAPAHAERVPIKRGYAHPTRLLVKRLESDPETIRAQASLLESGGYRVVETFDLVPGLDVIDSDSNSSYSIATANSAEELSERLIERINTLQSSGLYEYVEPDYECTAAVLPTDSYVRTALWGLRNRAHTNAVDGIDIDATRAWDLSTGSPNVIVAVIDSGIRYTHNELANRMWRNPGESGGGKESNGIDDDRNGFVDDVFGIDGADRRHPAIADGFSVPLDAGEVALATPYDDGLEVRTKFGIIP